MSCSLNLRAVSYKNEDKEIFNDISLNLGHEEKIAIVGSNGSGKSTLLKIIAGLINPSSGYIEVFHEKMNNLKDFSKYRSDIGYLPQDVTNHFLCPTVIEDVIFSLRAKGVSKNEALRLIDGLPDLDEVKISEEKQRENVYRSAIVNEDCQSLFQVIRTTYLRKEDRIAHGRKCTAVDEKYQRAAEDILYSELSYSLNIQKDQVKDFITDRIGSLK